MARKAARPGTKAYFDTLRKVFKMEAEVLTGTLPHYGERGRNDEERFRDVVIYDTLHNAPLHRELASVVFPIEMVYATIEIKGSIRSKDLEACIRK